LTNELTLLALVVESQRGVTANLHTMRNRIEKLCRESE
jgi:hypothetical protein